MSKKIAAGGVTNPTAGEALELDGGGDDVNITADNVTQLIDTLLKINTSSAITNADIATVQNNSNTAFHVLELDAGGGIKITWIGVLASAVDVHAVHSITCNTSTDTAALMIKHTQESPGAGDVAHIGLLNALLGDKLNTMELQSFLPLGIYTHHDADTDDIEIYTGDANTTTSGNLTLRIGSANTVRGILTLDTSNLIAKLGDNAGTNKVSITDSDDAEVASIDSNGDIDGNNVTSANISATETQPGTSEIATQAEVTTGTDDERIVTPLKLATGVYTKSQVDILVDATMKAPEAYDPTITGNYPITYGGSAVEAGDSFRITAAGTMGGITVNIEDLLIALVDAPAQVDANWMVAESNRDQATETVKGVAELATQTETNAGVDDLRIITPLKLDSSTQITSRVVGPAGATDHAIARYDLATGKLIQDSGGSIDDAGNITGNNLSGINTGDEVAATEGTAGIAELATQVETDAGTDDARIVTPLKLRTTPEFRNLNQQVATPYLAVASDDTIAMTVAGAGAINLPTVIGITGKVYTAVRLSPAGPNAVTVTPNGIETIGGAASFTMNAFQQSITFQSDGVSNWILI